MDIFARAAQNASLAPLERAVLKLLQGLLMAGVVAVLPVLSQALAQQSVNWGETLHTALAAAGVAVMAAFWKWCSAQGDPALPSASTSSTPQAAAALAQDALNTIAGS